MIYRSRSLERAWLSNLQRIAAFMAIYLLTAPSASRSPNLVGRLAHPEPKSPGPPCRPEPPDSGQGPAPARTGAWALRAGAARAGRAWRVAPPASGVCTGSGWSKRVTEACGFSGFRGRILEAPEWGGEGGGPQHPTDGFTGGKSLGTGMCRPI